MLSSPPALTCAHHDEQAQDPAQGAQPTAYRPAPLDIGAMCAFGFPAFR
jgi:hypothetical protein